MAVAASHRTGDADDFRQFYRAATLAQAHQSVFAHPGFSPDTNTDGAYLPFNRIPSYAEVLRPLASLPYPAARRVWIGLIALAFLGCLWLSPIRRDRFAMALAFSFPVAMSFALGQDIAFILLIVLATARIYATQREFLAGLLASLLAIKFTWLPAVGLVFLAKSRRGTAGLALGIAVQLAVCFAAGGIGWPGEYLASLRRSNLIFEAQGMPNIRGVAASLGLPDGVWVLGTVIVLIWLYRLCGRLSFTDALVVALALGLIASPYGFLYDAVALLPLVAALASLDSWDGWLASAALTPAPWLLLMTDGSLTVLAGSVLAVASAVGGTTRLTRLVTSGRDPRTASVPLHSDPTPRSSPFLLYSRQQD